MDHACRVVAALGLVVSPPPAAVETLARMESPCLDARTVANKDGRFLRYFLP